KPSNVLVRPDGHVVVLDFGLAGTQSDYSIPDGPAPRTVSVVLGTPAYMAPEQTTSLPPTPAVDWYSVGVVLYESLTGRRPFMGTGLEVLQAKQREAPPDPRQIAPGVPDDLAELAVALLDPVPDRRPDGEQVLKYFDPPLVG